MKKTTLFLLVASSAITMIVSCSKNSGENRPSEFPRDNSGLLSQLKSYNDSLMLTKPITKSRWKNLIGVGLADIGGVLAGGERGAEIGGEVGLILGNPITGAAFGAFVGGVVVGGLASYANYQPTLISDSPDDFDSLYSQVMDAAIDLWISYNENGVPDPDGVSADSDSLYALAVPEGYDSAIAVGSAHNTVLELALDNLSIEETVNRTRELSQLEISIVNNSDLYSLAWLAYNNQLPEGSDTIDEEILSLFIESYSQYLQDVPDVVSLANDYMRIIDQSNELSEQEQSNIYSSLTVAAYTTHFWKSRLFTNNNE